MSGAFTVRENPPFICDRSSLGFFIIKKKERRLSRYVIPDLSEAAFTHRRRKGHQRGEIAKYLIFYPGENVHVTNGRDTYVSNGITILL